MKHTASKHSQSQDHEHNNNEVAQDHHPHEHTFKEEMLHHLPYAIFSVALAMIILSLLDFSGASHSHTHHHGACDHSSGFNLLFHSFHFLHILFAATGTIITFFRFSNNLVKGLIIGILSPAFFCILSDVILPYVAGEILGVHMDLHICFHEEYHNIIPFLVAGIVNGFVLKNHHTRMLGLFSVGSHFAHILISSLASLFYMVSHGFENWYASMGIVFIFLVVAVVIPCTLSDVIVPMYFAGVKKDEKH